MVFDEAAYRKSFAVPLSTAELAAVGELVEAYGAEITIRTEKGDVPVAEVNRTGGRPIIYRGMRSDGCAVQLLALGSGGLYFAEVTALEPDGERIVEACLPENLDDAAGFVDKVLGRLVTKKREELAVAYRP